MLRFHLGTCPHCRAVIDLDFLDEECPLTVECRHLVHVEMESWRGDHDSNVWHRLGGWMFEGFDYPEEWLQEEVVKLIRGYGPLWHSGLFLVEKGTIWAPDLRRGKGMIGTTIATVWAGNVRQANRLLRKLRVPKK